MLIQQFVLCVCVRVFVAFKHAPNDIEDCQHHENDDVFVVNCDAIVMTLIMKTSNRIQYAVNKIRRDANQIHFERKTNNVQKTKTLNYTLVHRSNVSIDNNNNSFARVSPLLRRCYCCRCRRHDRSRSGCFIFAQTVNYV